MLVFSFQGQVTTCMFAGCPFLDHLQGVQHVLEGWNEQESVCYIGLYHSIYGSELFVSNPVFLLSFDMR